MATDHQTAPDPALTRPASPIENELPTYRAISTWAIAALILGVISAATFASLSFVLASVGAVACGAVALRSIRRYPDLLTGSGLANLGIALGLVTGLAAPTVTITRHTIVGKQAQVYGEQFAETLQDKGLAEAFWVAQPAPRRDQITPDQLLAEVQATTPEEMMAGGDPRLAAMQSMTRRLNSTGDQHVHVDDIEGKGFEGTTPFAYIRLMLDGPESDEFPAEQFALVKVKAMNHEGRRDWYVDDVVFPYSSGSRAKVVESAHGHEH